MRRTLITGLTVVALAATPAVAQAASAGATTASAKARAVPTDGTYLPVTPARIKDTRSTGKVPAGSSTTVQVTGRGGVPTTGVLAVVANLTVTGGTKPGYLSAYPSGTAFPGTSALNFGAGETRANLVTVPVGADGAITVLNGGGTGTAAANVIVDVQGYYLSNSPGTEATPALFQNYSPYRVLDTRTDGGPLGPDEYIDLLTGDYDEVGGDVTVAYAVNITAVGPTAPGYLVAWDGATDEFPATSVLNFAKGRTTPNNVVVPAHREFVDDEDGGYYDLSFAIGNGSTVGSANVLVDVVGVYVQSDFGLAFRKLSAPQRIVDTRVNKGLSKLGANQTRVATAPSTVLDPDDSTEALVGNLTAVRPTKATFLTVWPFYSDENERPEVSSLNPALGQTVANHAYVSLGEDYKFNVYNNVGSTDVLLDVTGYFDFVFGESTSAEAARAEVADRAARAEARGSRTTATRHQVR